MKLWPVTFSCQKLHQTISLSKFEHVNKVKHWNEGTFPDESDIEEINIITSDIGSIDVTPITYL